METMVNIFLKLFQKKEESTTKRCLKIPSVEGSFSVVGKYLVPDDVDNMYESFDEIPCTCPYCLSKLKSIPNVDYRPNKRTNDMYFTYDGFFIVSEKFKLFCEKESYRNLTFIKLKKTRYYFFEPQETFKTYIYWDPFNTLGHWCNHCMNYTDVCGGVLKDKSFALNSNDYIYRTDKYHGSLECKFPLIIVGLETMKKMKDYGLKGIYFRDVWG